MNSKKIEQKLITIETFTSSWTAEVVRARLEFEGISAFIQDQNIHFTFGPVFNQGYRLQVFEKDFLKALNIYKKSLQEEE